jgi:hypothetical protein
MKIQIKAALILAACMAAFTSSLFAQLAIPSDGSDGALVISTDTVIDLSQAVTGNWTNNNTANVGKGIYDPNQWAVVFKYSSITIAPNATVTFLNHPTHAPVVWLVSSDATINGTISLDGQSWNAVTPNLNEPGPGGFRGGFKSQSGFGVGGGFGPGGYYGDSGSYSTYHSYGNEQIIPLIGGSGGGGWARCSGNYNGGAGGGAILIAASGTITFNGYCHANGGNGVFDGGWAFCHYQVDSFNGSGGAIKMIANQILGNGSIEAVGGSADAGSYPGRIRLEANTTSSALTLNPSTPAVLPNPLVIWPAATAPTVQVVSVSGTAAPADPKASMFGNGDDILIAQTNAVVIQLQTANFPTSGTVSVFIKPLTGAQSILPASFVSGNSGAAIWQVTTVLPLNHTVIQALAVSN